MPKVRSCFWCGEVNVMQPSAATFCPVCFHRADCPRAACTCPICYRRFWPTHSDGHTEKMRLGPSMYILAHCLRMQDAEDREKVMRGLRRNIESPLYSPEERGKLAILLGMIEARH